MRTLKRNMVGTPGSYRGFRQLMCKHIGTHVLEDPDREDCLGKIWAELKKRPIERRELVALVRHWSTPRRGGRPQCHLVRIHDHLTLRPRPNQVVAAEQNVIMARLTGFNNPYMLEARLED